MSEHPDHRYITALRKGQFDLLDEIYRQHADSIRKWVTKNSGSTADAQDVFQDALIALHQKANDPDFVLTCPLGALLFQICRNKWLYQLRKKKREAEVRIVEEERYSLEESLMPTLEAVEEEEIRQHKLSRSFRQLSELCRQLLQLLANGLSSQEVAVKLEMNGAGTVYRRKAACADRWRTLFDEQK